MKYAFTKLVLLLIAWSLPMTVAQSQSLLFSTQPGRTATGSDAVFNSPSAVAVDAARNLYVADTLNGTIRKIDTNDLVTTLAGVTGTFGSANGGGTNAQFYAPQGIAVDGSGVLYVADTANGTIRKVRTNALVTTFAGSAGVYNSFDGAGTNANFFQPAALAVDNSGNVYVADSWNHTIRKITSAGVVSTIAGLAGYSGSIDGTGRKARFNRPTGIALDSANNLFVTDSLNHIIRKVTPAGQVSTVAGLPGVWGSGDGNGNEARFFQPHGIIVDNQNNLFVTDSGNQTIRKIQLSGTNWVVSTVAGSSGSAGSVDGTGDAARFRFPAGLSKDATGYLFVGDTGNNKIRNERFELRFLSVLPDGRMHFSLNGKANVHYAIEASLDLVEWSVLTNLASADGVLDFIDGSPATDALFYRAKVSP